MHGLAFLTDCLEEVGEWVLFSPAALWAMALLEKSSEVENSSRLFT